MGIGDSPSDVIRPGRCWEQGIKMPRIDNDIKLDFKDVLLRPKRSTLKSRSEVDLSRSFTFINSGQTYNGIPIIAANMDTVGTFEMARALCKFSLFTAVHKHYSVEEWKEFAANSPDCLDNVAVSSGRATVALTQPRINQEKSTGLHAGVKVGLGTGDGTGNVLTRTFMVDKVVSNRTSGTQVHEANTNSGLIRCQNTHVLLFAHTTKFNVQLSHKPPQHAKQNTTLTTQQKLHGDTHSQ
ncbi:GMP reductase 2 isoform X1 [Pelobates cultripes]|uniref:GMP reductase n=1 Tax=Pelobates cultripes TaxID=61616 RepID=A0AAD1W9D8_PELCU|nr:GMP reductase 2 isoform X1 [Pelobates cultripes]